MESILVMRNRGRWILLVASLVLIFAGLRGEGLAIFDPSSEPVWGRKPVLGYFALTVGLAEDMKRGVPLSDAEFEIVLEIAQSEAEQLSELRLVTNFIIANEALSEAEKRVQINASGYNQSVKRILNENQSALQASLRPGVYERLVSWIESRWIMERGLRGLERQKNSPDAARKFNIYAAQYDSNGSYAVALPDKCIKFADSGNSICSGSGYATQNYSVKLTYNNKTITIQNFDSGPWNVDDNFWANLADPHPRRLFTDLPLGMPEAQAAYYDDYNGGLDQYDRIVTLPFAIDLGDGVWSDLGLSSGQNAWIDVTFTWTSEWENMPAEVVTLLNPTNLVPPYTGDMCITAWHRLFPLLIEGGQAAYLTLNVDTAGQSTNSAEWKPNLPSNGDYKVRAFIPSHGPINWLCPAMTIIFDTADAEYKIFHANGQTTVSKNQGPMSNQYLDLGTFEFEAGSAGKITLSDLNDEANLSHTIAFSAMQFRRELPAPTSTPLPSPTPTPTPTPTPIPDPYLYAGTRIVNPGENVTIPIGAANLQSPGLGQAVVDVSYDPEVIEIIDCFPDPEGIFDSESCDTAYDSDDVFPDTVRFTLNSPTGVPGNPLLANMIFEAIGAPGEFSWLSLQADTFNQPTGTPISIITSNGVICVIPCQTIVFLPVLHK
jgi:hypothetical protein